MRINTTYICEIGEVYIYEIYICRYTHTYVHLAFIFISDYRYEDKYYVVLLGVSQGPFVYGLVKNHYREICFVF